MQEVRTILTREQQSYRVLANILMSGESSDDALAILLPMENYRQKTIYKLQADHFINRMQKDDLKGYRLTRHGKNIMLALDAERFSFFGAVGADYSMRRTTVSTRKRQHRISETAAMMEGAGIEIYRDNKKDVFEKEPMQSGIDQQAAFFLPKEVKSQIDLTRKIKNSRITGVFLSRHKLWLCYNFLDEMPNWYENVENRADILLRSMLREELEGQEHANALLFGRSMEQMKQYLSDNRQRAFLRSSVFEKICFVPLDEKGILLLRMLSRKEQYEYLLAVLSEDMQPSNEMEYFIHDGFNADGQPVLFFLDGDLKRLILFQIQMLYTGRRGEVICFDFQKEAVREYCGEETKISEVLYEKVRELFSER